MNYRDFLEYLPPDARPLDNDFIFVPQYSDQTQNCLENLVQKAQQDDPDYVGPNFANYFLIEIASEDRADRVLEILRSWPIVNFAHLHPGPVKPPTETTIDPLAINQAYLYPQPEGIDAIYAWTVKGGDGEGQRFADVEWGWFQEHQDLTEHSYTNIADGFYDDVEHGTSVLGIIAAHVNQQQCQGIVHNVRHIVTVGQWRSPFIIVTAEAIANAICALDSGDVLLIEVQTVMYGHVNIALEAEPSVFDLVDLATRVGITVVAAAGNGAKNFDLIEDDQGGPVFAQDSGGILVAAAERMYPPHWTQTGFTCFGDRLDCFAQGTQVVTLTTYGDGTSQTTSTFGGTSSASAIVAGAALSIQGVAEHCLGSKLSPAELREFLTAPDLNTLPYSPAHKIGVMPNLRNIIEKLLN
ncbi:MAG TPA: S8 family serine peptidase [Xanthomonadales bacterium]|nr:S8 family serine peptidase [Xanthomonadales bacterium]